ncbi:hypothetical protein ACOSQ3_002748 [Xanthoceras sorbifolium]
MRKLQEESSEAAASTGTSGLSQSGKRDSNMEGLIAVELIQALLEIPEKRDLALATLFKIMASCKDLAPLLWNSFGAICILLQEITSVYWLLLTPNLDQRISNRAAHAVGLFKCIASHPHTRKQFCRASLLLYIYPFLGTRIHDEPHETLRTVSLGVIGGLVAHGEAEVVHLLLETGIVPCCITCMEVGNVYSKTVAAFIIHKILDQEMGLDYCCRDGYEFFTLLRPLLSLLEQLVVESSPQLLKQVIFCCLRFTNHPRAIDVLTDCLPQSLKHRALLRQIDDRVLSNCLEFLIRRVTLRAKFEWSYR